MRLIERNITDWYKKNKRDLPWRKTKDPYKIWISEIILQQTRVAQGISYYEKFISAFPDIASLAKAPEKDVLKLWQGLGYYSRARNLHTSAQYILEKLNGKFPESFNDLLNLKGVGKYTAAAIASISFNEAVPVVDGNVMRVISRLFGITEPIDTIKGQKEIYAIAEKLLNKKQAGEFNQAVMEFGALLCTPDKPECKVCPLQQHCFANNNEMIEKLPVKSKKTKITQRFFTYFHIIKDNNTFIYLRTKNDIWKSLYEFPVVESKKSVTEKTALQKLLKRFISDISNTKIEEVYTNICHKLSHQNLNITFVLVKLNPVSNVIEKNLLEVPEKMLEKFPVHALMEKYLSKKFSKFAISNKKNKLCL